MRTIKFMFLLLTVISLVLFQIAEAEAHWNMEPRLWSDDSREKFNFTIHNGSHANVTPTTKDLEVCYWVEKRNLDTEFEQVSEKECSFIQILPDDWFRMSFKLNDVVFYEGVKNTDTLKKGSYRAVVVAREQKGLLKRIILGAAFERLYSYFEIK